MLFVQSYNDTIMLIKREKKFINSFWELNGPLFVKSESPSHKDDLCQVLIKYTSWFWRRECEKFTSRWTDGQTMNN